MIKELTAREKSLLKQGKQIVTHEQEAVCYLIAKYAIKEKLPNFSLKGVSNYSIYSGMNPETFRRNVEKYKLLFLGLDEDEEETSKENLYPKIINSYNEFNEMKESDVYDLAELAFTKDNEHIGQIMYEQHLENASKYTEQAKKKNAMIATKVTSLYKSLFAIYKDTTKAKRQSISKISQEMDIAPEKIQEVWSKDLFLKNIK